MAEEDAVDWSVVEKWVGRAMSKGDMTKITRKRLRDAVEGRAGLAPGTLRHAKPRFDRIVLNAMARPDIYDKLVAAGGGGDGGQAQNGGGGVQADGGKSGRGEEDEQEQEQEGEEDAELKQTLKKLQSLAREAGKAPAIYKGLKELPLADRVRKLQKRLRKAEVEFAEDGVPTDADISAAKEKAELERIRKDHSEGDILTHSRRSQSSSSSSSSSSSAASAAATVQAEEEPSNAADAGAAAEEAEFDG